MARAFINEIKDFKIISIDNELEILEKFELGKKNSGLVIVFMDELEYLYKKNHRDLLTAFDSLNSSSNVFIVATTNELDNVEGPLTRRGRLDFLIEIGRPNENERIEILKYYFPTCNVEADINYDYLSYITTYLTSAELKVFVNDSVLRYGNHLTITYLEAEIDRLRNRK
jgi:SpoVK/Ycf46/Vps4 family AAA+-type ATPase